MATCSSSSRPLSELSKHFAANSAAANAALEFTPQPIQPSSSSSFRSAPLKHRKPSIESDWANFAAAPAATPPSRPMPIAVPRAPIAASEPSDDIPASPYWNPELETQAVLSSSWSSAASARTYDVPSADEAFSISSSPATSHSGSFYRLPHTGSDDHQSSVVKEAQTPPHPLTFDPAPHAAWDFDKLFSKRRRWFGGARIPYDDPALEDESTTPPAAAADDHSSAERHGRPGPVCAKVLLERQAAHDRDVSLQHRASRVSSRSRDRSAALQGQVSQHSRLCNEIPDVVPEEDIAERQQAAFQALRRTAMNRLQLVGGHLDSTKKTDDRS